MKFFCKFVAIRSILKLELHKLVYRFLVRVERNTCVGISENQTRRGKIGDVKFFFSK